MSVKRRPNSPYWYIEFQVNHRTIRGTSKTKNKKEAEALEREWREQAIADNKAMVRSGREPITLRIAASQYITQVMDGKPSAGDAYRALDQLVRFIGGSTRMEDITDRHIAAYVANRRMDRRFGKATFKDGTPMTLVSGATINREVAVLKRVFRRVVRTCKIPLPNEPDWRSHRQAEEQERVREFNDQEQDKLYAGIRPDYLPWFEFAHNSGLRLAETILRWTSVNFKTGQIRVKGKGDKWVVAQITPTIRAILQPLVGDHGEYVFTYVAKRTIKRLNIERGQRYPLTYSGIQSHWRRFKKANDLHDLRIHDIRHDAASKIVRATGNLKIAKVMLNHSSITVTDKYAHVLGSEVADAMETVAKSRILSRTHLEKSA